MEKPAYGSGGDHCTWQPAVQWNKGCFHSEPCHEQDECKPGKIRRNCGNCRVTTCNKIKSITHCKECHDACKNGNSTTLCIYQIFSPCCKCLLRFIVNNERVGGNRQYFIKHKQPEEIGGEGNSHNRTDTNCETGIVPGLGMFFQPAHVPDAVYCGDDP